MVYSKALPMYAIERKSKLSRIYPNLVHISGADEFMVEGLPRRLVIVYDLMGRMIVKQLLDADGKTKIPIQDWHSVI